MLSFNNSVLSNNVAHVTERGARFNNQMQICYFQELNDSQITRLENNANLTTFSQCSLCNVCCCQIDIRLAEIYGMLTQFKKATCNLMTAFSIFMALHMSCMLFVCQKSIRLRFVARTIKFCLQNAKVLLGDPYSVITLKLLQANRQTE